MLNKLTNEQVARLDEYKEKWLAIGLSTEPCNFEEAKKWAIEAYKAAGLNPPKEFYLCDSPLSAATFIAEQNKKISVKSAVLAQSYGAHDAGWLAFYNYFLEVCNLKCCEQLIPLMELAKHCGWWAPYDTVVVFQHRPCEILWDDQQRIHCENGPAIKYRDGFAVYCWHGVRVPKEWILDKSLSAADAIRWDNMEQRRAACEIIGWVNVLEELNARTIDKHKNPMVGELIEVDIPDIGPEKFLRVKCGTNRLFALPVPPNMKTAEESQRWLNFIPDDITYLPEIRT